MPFVTIHMWPGRTAEVKAKLIKDVTEAVRQMEGVPLEAIEVVIAGWGVRSLACYPAHFK